MLRLMSSAVFIRPGYCGVTWYIPRTLQRTRKPLCFQHTWYRFYDELEKGDILYRVTRGKLTIFEVEKVEETSFHGDRCIVVDVIDRITSNRFSHMIFPTNIKLMDYFATAYGIYTTREEVAVDFFKSQDFFVYSWLF